MRTVSGESLDEPPAVEGYLWRVKPVSGALTRLYLTTHDGHAFICRSSRAYPPDRHLATAANDTLDMRIPRTAAQAGAGIEKPRHKGVRRAFDRLLGREKSVRREETMANLRQQVMETVTTFATTAEEVQARIDAYRAFEKRRQFEQINGADGYVDLRDIRAIRRVGDGLMRRPSFEDKRAAPRSKSAKSEAHSATGSGAKVEEDAANAGSDEEEFSDGEADVGGEEGLAASKDRAALRQMRQFEVVMKNGRSTRFETYSKQVAREWIDRLSDLARYWKRREKVDALELMNVSGFDPALIHRHKQERSNPRSLSLTPDMDTIAPMLGSLWHWCAIQGCRGIIRCGRLFHKKKLHAPFRSRYYILIAGRLLHYKLVTTTSSARSRQNAGIFHRRQETVVHLRDAYVFSGQLTEDLLQNGRTEGAQGINNIGGGGGANAGERHKLPRVYQDGLLSVDEDEDCSFVVRYRPEHKNADVISPGITSTPAADGAKPNASPSALPTLSDKKHKYLVLRARSKMERDLWVRAISYETEREARLNADREMRLKTVGTVDR